MNGAPNVAHLNATFPQYPITVMDKGWIYGVWYCSRCFQKNKLYGQYPTTFLKRALALFPGAKNILHCPSGTVQTAVGITVDMVKDAVRCPQVVADACALPFSSKSFDLVLSDPPYSDLDAENSRHRSLSSPESHAGVPPSSPAARTSRATRRYDAGIFHQGLEMGRHDRRGDGDELTDAGAVDF